MTDLLKTVFRHVYRCWLEAKDDVAKERFDAQMVKYEREYVER